MAIPKSLYNEIMEYISAMYIEKKNAYSISEKKDLPLNSKEPSGVLAFRKYGFMISDIAMPVC